MDNPQGSSRPLFQVKLEFGMLVFAKGEKLDDPEKNPWSKDENQQQTQPTCDIRSWKWTQATVVEGKCSHHCAIPAAPKYFIQDIL